MIYAFQYTFKNFNDTLSVMSINTHKTGVLAVIKGIRGPHEAKQKSFDSAVSEIRAHLLQVIRSMVHLWLL